ncbi:hypothetical protein GCM10007907_25730 [Chitinimonas prasina]|uniref:LysR substrate-binding domain-containing protein n=1 Tax=Chitinimonas prasina TaxID=1434937 RepID=A0ABQ5YH62_9NEIS|nr:hypothetical protein GCM10007907_25730 [Chitinimonas prasina]
MQLTEAGLVLAQRLAASLQGLHLALQAPGEAVLAEPLRVYTLPSFASAWLVPRLADFQLRYPQIGLCVETGYALAQLPPHLPTVALRYGVLAADGLATDLLLRERLVAVATPAWIARFGEDPSLWPAAQMLRLADSPWPSHTPGKGRRRVALPLASGMLFNDGLLLVQAAAAGLGVAWARSGLVGAAQPAGRLAAIAGLEADSGKAYWLAYRTELASHPAVAAFREWTLAQWAE